MLKLTFGLKRRQAGHLMHFSSKVNQCPTHYYFFLHSCKLLTLSHTVLVFEEKNMFCFLRMKNII